MVFHLLVVTGQSGNRFNSPVCVGRPTVYPTYGKYRSRDHLRQPFIMSSQQYMAHGCVTGLQRSLRPLKVWAARKRSRCRSSGGNRTQAATEYIAAFNT